jgi:hypothetical protein
MKKFAFAALAALSTIGFSTSSEAASCITKYLTGVWVGTVPGDDSEDYCIVQFKENGWIIQASCFDRTSLKSTGTFDGRFNVTKSCDVSGNFDVIPIKGKKQDVVFTGTMNPEKGIMDGQMKPKGQKAVSYKFVEQWN